MRSLAGSLARFAAPLLADHPGVVAVQWAPRTDPSQRAEHFPILFSEPRNARAGAAGSDLAANPVCHEAIRRACDLGEPALTDRIPLMAEPGKRREVRLFTPIYQKNAAIDNVENRRKHLQGFVVGVLSPKQVVEEALRTLVPAGIDIWLVDSTDRTDEHPLYYHRSRLRPGDSDPSGLPIDTGKDEFHLSDTLDVAGRRWRVTCVAVPQFIAARTTWYPWGAAAAGLLLTGLLAAYLAGIAKRDAQTVQLAAQLTETHRRLEKESADRQQAESTLRASQTKYKTLYELSSDAIMLLTPEEGFLGGNAATVALYGCKDEKEFTSNGPADLSPEYQPDGRLSTEKAREMMSIAMEEGTHVFQWKHKRLDGAEFFSIVTLTRMELEGKRFLQATVHDISEQKRTQEALRAGEKRLRLFVENVSDVVWTMDFSGRFTYMSPSMQQMLGHKWEESERLTIADIMTPFSLSVFLKALKAVTSEVYTVQRVETRTLELELLRQDGSTVWSELTVSGMSDELGEIVAVQGVARDISERKQAEQRQTRLLKRLEGVNRLQARSAPAGRPGGKAQEDHADSRRSLGPRLLPHLDHGPQRPLQRRLYPCRSRGRAARLPQPRYVSPPDGKLRTLLPRQWRPSSRTRRLLQNRPHRRRRGRQVPDQRRNGRSAGCTITSGQRISGWCRSPATNSAMATAIPPASSPCSPSMPFRKRMMRFCRAWRR